MKVAIAAILLSIILTYCLGNLATWFAWRIMAYKNTRCGGSVITAAGRTVQGQAAGHGQGSVTKRQISHTQ